MKTIKTFEAFVNEELKKTISLNIIQDMYTVSSTVDQGYEPNHDVKRAEKKEKEYKRKYPNEYNFVSGIATEDEYAGPGDKTTTDKEALKAVGYTLSQIRNI